MTRMLASVAGPEEAAIALAHGADIIDLKDPAAGALGAVSPDVLRHTVAQIGARRPVSAVAGDLAMQPALWHAAVERLGDCGLAFIKLGIFPGGEPAACVQAVAPLAGRTPLVAVLFADRSPDLSLLPLLAEAGFHGAMLDTAGKRDGRLLNFMDLPQLGRFVAECRRFGLLCGLAGALEPPDIPRLLVLDPGLLGFRGALCGGDRRGLIEAGAVDLVRALIPGEDAEGGRAGPDLRLLAARGYAPDPAGDPALTDRVFVQDLVLPARIGLYAHERETPQRVRFGVEVVVSRPRRNAADLRDVFSYDIISDGIRMLLAAGHVGLVETLAERIAALLLAHRRVLRVLVRVEKLETGAGVVGVALERTRATDGAR